MKQKFTVIWRPLEEHDYRLDWIEAEPDYRSIMIACGQAYLDETDWGDEGPPMEAHEIFWGDKGGYDHISTFEGHLREVFPS